MRTSPTRNLGRRAAGLTIAMAAVVGFSLGGTSSASTPATPSPVGQPDPTSVPSTMPETAGPATTDVDVDSSCRAEPTGPMTYVWAQRPGVDPDRSSVDVHLPEGCDPVPAVMGVRGGGWRRGDKATGLIERRAARAESLSAALVSVNYQLTTPDSGVRWPGHREDVAAAVAWVQTDGPALGWTSRTSPCSVVEFDLATATATATAPARTLITDAFGTDPELISAASPNVQVERNGPPNAQFLVVTRGGSRASRTRNPSSTSSTAHAVPQSSSTPTPTPTTR